MYQIVNVLDSPLGISVGAHYIHQQWGSESNYAFYLDAIQHSSNQTHGSPKFFLLMKHDQIVGCYALITNDFISRHDLMPWFACLFVEPEERGQALSQKMFEHATEQARAAGYSTLYLTTDHNNFYEKFGWERIEDGFDLGGSPTRIYRLPV